MPERNEKWEQYLESVYKPPVPMARPRVSLKDLIERECVNVARDFEETFWNQQTSTASTPITEDLIDSAAWSWKSYSPEPSPQKQYDYAMDEYLDNGVPQPKPTYDPKTQPWWEMPVEEVE